MKNLHLFYRRQPNGWASAARYPPNRQPSKLILNWRSWAGRLHAVLGAFCSPESAIHQEGTLFFEAPIAKQYSFHLRGELPLWWLLHFLPTVVRNVPASDLFVVGANVA